MDYNEKEQLKENGLEDKQAERKQKEENPAQEVLLEEDDEIQVKNEEINYQAISSKIKVTVQAVDLSIKLVMKIEKKKKKKTKKKKKKKGTHQPK